MKKWQKNIAALAFGIFISLLLAELILHIYNPLKTRVRGNEIELPANVKYQFHNVHIAGLDSEIVHQKNGLGFRGPELSAAKGKKIFCVGGSTTECFYLSDGKDWPALLMQMFAKNGENVWVNNAGLDGHSTWGHQILMRDYIVKLKPDVVVFLIGCNDVAAMEMNKYEKYHMAGKKRLLEYSEIFNIYNNYRRVKGAEKMGMGHQQIDLKACLHSDTAGYAQDLSYLKAHLELYRKNVLSLIEICQKNGIKPVFISQPTIMGDAVDSLTGRYLGDIEFLGKSALHYVHTLRAYNNCVKEICAEKNLLFVDAASAFPNSSRYYYDFFHYTNAGASLMAGIVYQALHKSDYLQ